MTRKQLASYLGKAMFGTATWHPAQGTNVVAPPTGNSLTTVDDSAHSVGWFTSITIGADGLPRAGGPQLSLCLFVKQQTAGESRNVR